MVEVPFFAGQEVGAPYFFDREQYRIELKTKLAAEAPLNFALTGPRRIGKTSLMKKVAEELDGEVIAIVIKCEKIMPNYKLIRGRSVYSIDSGATMPSAHVP